MAKKEENVSTDDAVLQMLLDLTDKDGVEIGLTLNMNGTVVAGTLIGPHTYYEGIIMSADHVENSTLSHVLHKKFTDLKEAYISEKQEEEEKKKQDMIATFIHLKDAVYISGNTQAPFTSHAWWRGRIDSIDGFSFKL
ncbi:hypothetical protein AB685_17570 [Bacillus sp. LL01]|uniref:gas vesicle accessory protein GvpU n=1 Tax=Bacillus sp. LL01 TaxID=1665556 RepID=UPI00064CE688|nr:gas vesicle accessory protein GvpU [Bacillus sp. LL01]KMJ57214.1 hypothetical protein AB685_17570 [Bacillus sp. LL01]